MTTIICGAIKVGTHEVDTVMKMERVIKTGLARLRAINAATEAERDPGAQQN